jgi:hypothetical protein
MASKIYSISFCCGEEVATFGGRVKGSDDGGETIFRASVLRLEYIRVLRGLGLSDWVVYAQVQCPKCV